MPIDYENKKAPKEKICEKNLYLADIDGFNSKVGFVTNVATTAFAMLPLFKENTEEYSELIDRLKRLRKEQGSTIDATKGLEIKPFPIHWTKWNKINEDDSNEIKNKKRFLNNITINKRPYFMRYVYSHYNKEYLIYLNKWKDNVRFNVNKTLDELLIEENLSQKEKSLINNYNKYHPFLETSCTMNKICWNMEKNISQLKISLKQEITDDIILLLKNKDIQTDPKKYKQLYDLYKKYKSEKRNFSKIKNLDDNIKFRSIDQFNKYIRQEANYISSNGSELANMAVDICYITHPNDNKNFLWSVFGDDLLENIYLNRQENILVPFLDKFGDMEYLGNKYKMKKINIDDIYDNEDFYEYSL